MKVSNELLGEVLEKNIVDSKYMFINRNIYYHEKGVIYAQTVNIYELAHKCKEWAYSQMLFLQSGRISDNKYKVYFRGDLYETWYADTEPEAIFKACEWILVSTDTKSLAQD